ncbi:MAG: WecB/TagA/CpsF family glycosyltransferase [Brevinema sp.]
MGFSEYYVFGVKVTDISRNEWRNYLYDQLHHSKYARIVILSEKKLFQAIFNRELMETINQADVVLCSSSMISWLMYRLHNHALIKPALPVTYILDAFQIGSECGSTVSFYGATKPVLFGTVKKVMKSFSGLRVVSHYPENIPLADQAKIFVSLRKSAAKLALFNLGNSKYQELWINKNYEIFKKGVTIGADDSFQVIAGAKSVPSLAMQEKGWLGLYELMRNPFNIAKMFRCTVLFIFYLVEMMKNKKAQS